MLEKLADHDDKLMEQLLEDIEPPRDKVFDDLAKELRDGLICPVLIGSATRTNGVLRLMKALRHEAPGITATNARLGLKPGADAVGIVVKTLHTAHGGKLSVTRVLAGEIADGASLIGSKGEAARVAGVFKQQGASHRKARRCQGRRHRGLRQARPHRHLRHGDHREDAAQASCEGRAAAAGDGGGDLVARAQGRRQARPGAAQARRRGPVAGRRAQRRDQRDRAVGPGRDAFARGGRAARRPLRPAGDDAGAGRRLPRDDQESGQPARPPQEAVRRPRPVRRRGGRHQAAAARLRLRVRRDHHRRRGAAPVHSVGGGGRAQLPQHRAPLGFPWSTCR